MGITCSSQRQPQASRPTISNPRLVSSSTHGPYMNSRQFGAWDPKTPHSRMHKRGHDAFKPLPRVPHASDPGLTAVRRPQAAHVAPSGFPPRYNPPRPVRVVPKNGRAPTPYYPPLEGVSSPVPRYPPSSPRPRYAGSAGTRASPAKPVRTYHGRLEIIGKPRRTATDPSHPAMQQRPAPALEPGVVVPASARPGRALARSVPAEYDERALQARKLATDDALHRAQARATALAKSEAQAHAQTLAQPRLFCRGPPYCQNQEGHLHQGPALCHGQPLHQRPAVVERAPKGFQGQKMVQGPLARDAPTLCQGPAEQVTIVYRPQMY